MGMNTKESEMYITEAYRILVSVKLHGAEASGVSPQQFAIAKQVVTAEADRDPLYQKVLRDLARLGR